MCYTEDRNEYKRGKLIPQRDKNETMEDCVLRILRREEKRTEVISEKDIFAVFEKELYGKYYLSKDNVYMIDCNDIDLSCDIAKAELLDNWEIEIELSWYSWDKTINSMIKQALYTIKK